MQLVLTLSENQVSNAVNWLMELIRQGKVLNYKFTSATLDMQYGGMIDGELRNIIKPAGILFDKT